MAPGKFLFAFAFSWSSIHGFGTIGEGGGLESRNPQLDLIFSITLVSATKNTL